MTISPRIRPTLLNAVLVALLLGITPVAIVTGCRTQTLEAVTYNSFRTTWDVTHASYEAWCAKVVSGKVSPTRERHADLAWNQFRRTFRQSFVAASQNWSAPVGTNVLARKDNFLNSIK